MNYEKIDAYLAAHRDDLLADLAELVAIDSEYMEPEEGFPYGKGSAAALARGAELLETHGLKARNYENHVITADLFDDLEPGLDILAHLDVVPAGDGWTVTDPFVMKIQDGKAYGRGTVDDKGPGLCALYAMLAVRDCGVKLAKNVRIILGGDEECGSRDIEYYFTKEKSAPMSISPDAEYPLINIEKGVLHSGFTADLQPAETLPRLLAFDSGVKINVVPDKASALVEGVLPGELSGLMTEMAEQTGCRFEAEKTDEGTLIKSFGKNGHASTPFNGVNALTALLKFVAALPLSEAPLHSAIKGLAKLFPHGAFYGEGLGVNMEDEISNTTLTLDIMHYAPETGLSGQFDCRACLKATDENTTEVINEQFRALGLTPMDEHLSSSHCVPADSELVQTLMKLYNGMTGKDAKPLCIGGGTYVHEIEGGVAFGICELDEDNNMHGADEFITMEQIDFACRIYARAIVELCGVAE
ncbi:MAG: Sapep family Mn(2+)-dependent dipeptidase [Firmicutes bacterium]|nr:Sapep family Mn(2+)-dependent dipeptidase [Bacillota bacterium]